MARVRIYEPYGYREELDYQSRKTKLDSELERNRENDKKEFDDLSELFEKSFTEVVYDVENAQFLFKNVSGDTKGVANMADIIPSDLVADARYDADTKSLVITFKNGQTVEIPIDDLIDVHEFGDGLEVVSGTVRVKLDENGEAFLTVGEDGLKLDGVQDAIDAAVAVVDAKLDVEIARAISAETALDEKIDAETARATSKEGELAGLIAAEASNRLSADNVITSRLNSEISRSTSPHEALDARTTELEIDLENETTARQDAVEQINASINNINTRMGILDDKIGNEKDRAQTAENTITSNLNAEISRATTRENAIENALNAETTRAQNAESALSDSISAIQESISGLSVYSGDGKTIAIRDIDGTNDKEISSTISMLKIVSGLDANVQEAYQLVDANGDKIGDQINIYKDSSLLAVAVVNSPASWDAERHEIVGGSGDTVLAFAYQLSDSESVVVTEIPLSELVTEAQYKDGLQVNENHEVSVKVDATSEGFLSVSQDGVKVSGVQDAIDTAVSDRLSGVSVNGKTVTVTNNKASFTISASTIPFSGTPNAIVIDTDENGNITIGLGIIDGGSY